MPTTLDSWHAAASTPGAPQGPAQLADRGGASGAPGGRRLRLRLPARRGRLAPPHVPPTSRRPNKERSRKRGRKSPVFFIAYTQRLAGDGAAAGWLRRPAGPMQPSRWRIVARASRPRRAAPRRRGRLGAGLDARAGACGRAARGRSPLAPAVSLPALAYSGLPPVAVAPCGKVRRLRRRTFRGAWGATAKRGGVVGFGAGRSSAALASSRLLPPAPSRPPPPLGAGEAEAATDSQPPKRA